MKNPFKRMKQEKKVDAALLTAYPGYAKIEYIQEKGAEFLKVGDKDVYIGELPRVVEINPNMLPIPKYFKIMWRLKRFRIRLHYKKETEPFTRDLFTGSVLCQDKKKKVLKEKGFIDEQGFLLNRMGERVNIDGSDIIVDVSNIDFMQAEYKAYNDSKITEKAAAAMEKTGKDTDQSVYIILGISLITNVILVFLMQGGFSSLGL